MGIIDLGKVRPDIIDTLTSDDATNALSARQGKVLKMMVDEKQDKLTVDSVPVNGSANPVSSGGVFNAMLTKQDKLTVDSAPVSGSANPISSGGVFSAMLAKQDKLTVDSVPVNGSANPVSSGGVFNAMLAKAQVLYSNDTAANARALLLAKVSHVTDKPDGCYLIYGGWSGNAYGVSLIGKADSGNAYVVMFFAGATAYQAYIYNNSGVLTIGVATQFTVTNL